MPKLACNNCGNYATFGDDFAGLARIPWCPSTLCFASLYSLLPENFTREDLYKAYTERKENQPYRADQLLVELRLAAPCHCNKCQGRG